MTGDELSKVVNLLVSTWPSGVRGFVWTTELGLLDYPRAEQTYRQLVRSEDRPPSVARFIEVYKTTDPRRLLAPDKPENTGPTVGLHEVVDRLEWRVGTGAATEAEVVQLETFRRYRSRRQAEAVERHPTTGAQNGPPIDPGEGDDRGAGGDR